MWSAIMCEWQSRVLEGVNWFDYIYGTFTEHYPRHVIYRVAGCRKPNLIKLKRYNTQLVLYRTISKATAFKNVI